MPVSQELLRVYESGPTTVVGLGDGEFPEYIDIAEVRDEVIQLLRQNSSGRIAFELAGIAYVPSAVLGLFASIRAAGFGVVLLNPSKHVRSVLEVTRLDRLFEIRNGIN